MKHTYGFYESRHVESVGKGNAFDWNRTTMDRITEAYNDYRLTEEW